MESPLSAMAAATIAASDGLGDDAMSGTKADVAWMHQARATKSRCAVSLPDQVVRHLELCVVRIIFRGCRGRLRASVLAMVEHDHVGIALTYFLRSRPWQQLVAIAGADDRQCAGGQFLAQLVV